jgi:hypothetical protein
MSFAKDGHGEPKSWLADRVADEIRIKLFSCPGWIRNPVLS